MASVWDTALGLPVLQREGYEELDGDARYLPAVVGSVAIGGVLEGVVAMSAPRWLAAECGALMYSRDPADLTEPSCATPGASW